MNCSELKVRNILQGFLSGTIQSKSTKLKSKTKKNLRTTLYKAQPTVLTNQEAACDSKNIYSTNKMTKLLHTECK